MNYDDLRPLKWHHALGEPGWQLWAARTPVCAYKVVQWNDNFRWDYSYYFQSESIECESREAGMAAAWDHWKNLVRQIVEPHDMDGEILPSEPFSTE